MPGKATIWNSAPAIRFVIALCTGILLQWHLQFSLLLLFVVAVFFIVSILFYSFSPVHFKFRFSVVNSVFIHLLLVACGALLVWSKDIRHSKNWIGHHYKNSDHVVAILEEPVVEKQNSFKALASFYSISDSVTQQKVKGKFLIYFKKDSSIKSLAYGSKVVFKKALQPIKNSGNPGGFNYNQYSLFQGITHQVYLTRNEFVVLPQKQTQFFKRFIYDSRKWVVNTLRKFIVGEKEKGLAEALLIGYKDDLDKNLVEAYSNTGVVHIIAISGLHLGLIYWLLLLLTKPLNFRKRSAVFRLVIILGSLWLFSILAGAGPSVLRSAVMFSFIAFGEVLTKRSSIYNTLALSAFMLLCYNPFFLWDVGFQLSYAAVLSIIIFFKPVYNWIYTPNKSLDFLWKLLAVTISAQVLTLPISIYHFHQMPLLFLFTNFIAVPVSSLILIGEVFLCAFSWFVPLANILGIIITTFIRYMNDYIEWFDKIPFAVWQGLSLHIIQLIILIVAVCSFCYWLMAKNKHAFFVSGVFFLLFFSFRTFDFIAASEQKKIIVYNVPRHQAIDVIAGRKFYFIGDTQLLSDNFLRNFHLQPSRILHRISHNPSTDHPKNFEYAGKNILVIDTTVQLQPASENKLDLLVLSRNPKVLIPKLAQSFNIKQVVIDGSVPQWKSRLWKNDCDSLKIPCHDVSEKGAFVMNLR